jgi:hypothetical protein
VSYWTREFGVSETELRAAAKAIGVMAAAVRAYVRKRN